jgi:2-succinyl-5-enolpyruvyl-6-hydroxy-3-cyclohexene-1-carboxylate synthase
MSHSPATTWSRAFLGELYSWGVRDIVLSPGSRSQALALAALEWERVTEGELRVHVVIDERSAAFRALGMATESGMPAVCVSTSGSAPGHYLPAVMEAHHSGTPLIVLSADRPEELRGVGANQTTVHAGLFGVFAPTISVPTPDEVTPEAVAAVASEVMTFALGSGRPVHLNVGFREPLSGIATEDLVIPEPQTPVSPAGAGDTVTLDPAPGTLVIAGHGAGAAAEAFAVEIGAPLIAEAVSGAHFGPHLVLDYRTMVRELSASGAITRVITWGRPTLSREVWGLLLDTSLQHFVVRGSAAEAPNPSGVAIVVQGIEVSRPATKAETTEWVKPWVMAGRDRHAKALGGIVPDAPDLETLASSDPASRSAFATREVAVMRRPVTREGLALAIWEATWPHDRLVLGASRMVRVVDEVVGPKNITVYSNRGLSGIDGTVSFARGVAEAAANAGVTGITRVLLGDLALLHDAGSLMREPGVSDAGRVQVFVANDGGGTIFDSLEVKNSAPGEDFDRAFYTPHGVDLSSLAAAYSWSYQAVSTMGELTEALASSESSLLVDVSLPRD